MLHAVCIGIDQYQDNRITPLRYAANDAQSVGDLLDERIEPSERKVERLLDGEASRERVIGLIGEDLHKRVTHGDVVLLFFAGHGSPETISSNDGISRHLVMHDTDYDRIYSQGLDMVEDLQRLIGRLDAAALVVVILDACFSGIAGGRTFEGPHLQQMTRECRDRISLKELDLGEGRIILSACRADQVALESAELNHGFFTYELLEELRTPREELTVDVIDLFQRTRSRVRARTGDDQIPVFNGRDPGARLPAFFRLAVAGRSA